MFNIVKFPNDECKGDGGKNGTCYTGLTLKGLLLMVVINQFRVQLQPPSATCGRELQPAAAQMVTESAALVSLNQIVFLPAARYEHAGLQVNFVSSFLLLLGIKVFSGTMKENKHWNTCHQGP